MKVRNYFLVIFGFVFSLVYIIYFGWNNETFANLAGDLAAGFIGAFLTIFLIERALQKQERERIVKVRIALWKSIRAKLVTHLALLWRWKKIGKTIGTYKLEPLPMEKDFRAIFDEEYFELIRLINFTGKYEIFSKILIDFRNFLSSSLDIYLIFLQTNQIEKIVEIINSDFLEFFLSMGKSDALYPVKNEGIKQIHFPFLADQPPKWLKIYVIQVIEFIESFHSYVHDPIAIKEIYEIANLWEIKYPNNDLSEL